MSSASSSRTAGPKRRRSSSFSIACRMFSASSSSTSTSSLRVTRKVWCSSTSMPGNRVSRCTAMMSSRGTKDVIAVHLDTLFPGMEVLEHHTFRVTRNEDVEVEEDDAENILQAMEKELLRRRFGPAVRLELAEDIAPRIRELLVRELGVEPSEVYELPAPLDLTGLTLIADLDRADLAYPRFVGGTHRHLAEVESATQTDIFAAIARRDILLHHPYDSFATSVQAFLALSLIHISEPTRLGMISYAVFCLKKKK